MAETTLDSPSELALAIPSRRVLAALDSHYGLAVPTTWVSPRGGLAQQSLLSRLTDDWKDVRVVVLAWLVTFGVVSCINLTLGFGPASVRVSTCR